MLSRRIAKALFCSKKPQQLIPKPPKFLSGELEPFRYDFENSQLYDGYSVAELYGAKIGFKHPPAIRAEMVKDSVAASLILVVGVGICVHIHMLYKKEMDGIDRALNSKKTRVVKLPDPIYKNPAFN